MPQLVSLGCPDPHLHSGCPDSRAPGRTCSSQGMRVGRRVRPVRPQALDLQPHPLDLVTHACVYRGFVSFFLDSSDAERLERFFDSEDEDFEILSL